MNNDVLFPVKLHNENTAGKQRSFAHSQYVHWMAAEVRCTQACISGCYGKIEKCWNCLATLISTGLKKKAALWQVKISITFISWYD